MTFAEAVADDDGRSSGRSILLGNGFSIDWKPSVFAYGSLFDEAELSRLSESKEALRDALGTTDFESIIDYLQKAAELAERYSAADPDLSDVYRADARVVQDGLADVLADRHPHRADELSGPEIEHAREFLHHFGRIFTLNYDLLLYWVVNRSEGSTWHVQKADGFAWPSFNDRRYLVWKRPVVAGSQRIFYLHGALHLFVVDRKLHKVSYRISDPLMDQIRDRLLVDEYPRVVTEGSSKAKVERIGRSAYLTHAHQSFRDLSGTLFIHGVSLASNDEHILRAVEDGDSKVEALYVGVFDHASHEAEALMARARRIARKRQDNGGRRLQVAFYDSASAHVWR